MDPEALLLFILTSQLQIQEVTSRTTDVSLYSRSGQDVFLSCLNTSPGDTTCSLVSWIYSMDQIQSSFVVKEGKVERRFAQGSRLSLDTRCSLVIRNVTAEDVGGYTCRQGQDVNRDEQVSLSVMTVSPSEAGSDPGGVGEVTLRCTVRRPPGFFCLVGSLRWRDEAGTELRAEGTGRTLLRQTCCVSMVTVRRQAGPNRKYTCQFVDAEGIAIRADYTPDFSDGAVDHPSIIIIAVVAVVAGVGVLVVMVAVLIKYRKRSKGTEDVQKPSQPADEPGNDLTYMAVSHSHPQAPARTKVKEDEVTYSTVNTLGKKEAEDAPSSLYGRVSKLR
ncbi:uncharacterized protein LOC120808275 isoform X1 [Gasterosteus aculeatus]